MLSHNNSQELIKKYEPKKQHFTIKKLSVGVASVLLGVSFAAGVAHADTSAASQGANGAAADRQSQPSDQEATKQDSQVTVNSAAANQNPVISVNTSAAPVAAHQADQSMAATTQSAADQQKGSQAQVAGKQAKDVQTPATQEATQTRLQFSNFMATAAPTAADTTAADPYAGYKDVHNYSELQTALSDSSVSGINLNGTITATGDLNVTRTVTLHGIEGAVLNLGQNKLNNSGQLTLDDVTLKGSIMGSGTVTIKGNVVSSVDATNSSVPTRDQFNTQHYTGNINNYRNANIQASGLTVTDGASLTINSSMINDGINLTDGATAHVGNNATLNVNLTSTATTTERYHVAGVFMNNGGNFTTGTGSHVTFNTGLGQAISIGRTRPNTTDADRFGGYGTRDVTTQDGPASVALGNHSTFDFTGRDGILLGNNSNFTAGAYSNVHFENQGRGVALDLGDNSNIEIGQHANTYFHSVGKTGTSGSYDGYNYIRVNEAGNITIDEYATFRVILEGRGSNPWDDVISMDSRLATSKDAFTSKTGAIVDIRDDNTDFYAELISSPLGNPQTKIDIQDPALLNLQRYSSGGATTGYLPTSTPQGDNAVANNPDMADLVYISGTGGSFSVNASDYVVYQTIKADGSKQLWLNINGVTVPYNGFADKNIDDNGANPDLSISGEGLVGGVKANNVHETSDPLNVGPNAPYYGVSQHRASHQIWLPHETTIQVAGAHKNVIQYVYADGTPVLGADGKPLTVTQEINLTRNLTLDLDQSSLDSIAEYAQTHTADETLEFIKSSYKVTQDSGWQMTDANGNAVANPYASVASPTEDGYTAIVKSTNAPGVKVGADGSSVQAKFGMPDTDAVVQDGMLTDAYKNNGTTGIPADYDTVVEYVANQNAILKIVDDTTGDTLGNAMTAEGPSDTAISFANGAQSVLDYLNNGYVFVNVTADGTQAVLPGGSYDQVNFGNYDDDANVSQGFTVHLTHGVQPITPQTPTTDVPNNAPKEAQPDQLTKQVTETVTYVNADGTAFTGTVPANAKQTVTFTGTAYVDKVTGKLVNAVQQDDGTWVINMADTTTPAVKWTADGKNSFTAVTSPAETGYHVASVSDHADGNNVAAIPGLTQNSANVDITVTYDKDAPIEQGSVNVVYHDETTDQDLLGYGKNSGTVDAGTPFNYDPTSDENTLKGLGYEIVTQNPQIPTEVGNTAQTIKIDVKHGVQPVTPQTPTTDVPNNTPKEAQPDQLTKQVTETVTYVNADGTAFTGTVPANANQTVTFTGTAYVDKVTGQLVNAKQVDGTWVIDKDNTAAAAIAWTPETGSFTAVDSPAEAGYHVSNVSDHADGDNVAAIPGLTQDSASVNITVTYTKNGEDTKNKQTIPASQTVKYVDEQGNELPQAPAKTQNASFNYSGDTVDATTGELIKAGSWDATSHTFTAENVPVIDGYVAVSGYTVNGDGKVVAGGFTANEGDSDAARNRTFTVVYHKVGKIVPVDPGHNPIPDVPTPKYPNDPDNPTKVTPNDPVPEIPGYTPSTPTVTPGDPTKDTEVVYTPVQDQKAVVNYIDLDEEGGKQIATSGPLSGKAGAKIDYSTADEIAKLEDQGYELDYDGFPVGAIYDSDNNTTQEFTVTLRHKHTTLTPEVPGDPDKPINPKDPTGPKYPANTGENDLKKTGTQTVHYEGAGDNTPGDNTQSFDFTRTITIDNVTGEILHTSDWNVASHTFGSVDTPVVNGYHANQRTAGNQTVTPDDLNKTVTVTYSPNGKIVPVDPNGNPIPNVPNPQYPTDPADPTKVIPDEPVPVIPGLTPATPTVTPKDPGKDTPVVYTPLPQAKDQVAVVNYIDQDEDNTVIASSGTLSGKAGDKIDYSTADEITKLEDKGYVLVSDEFPADQTFDSDDNNVQTYYVYLKHGLEPINPENPGKPGDPINPKDPEGPKYPDGTDKASLDKTVTRTIEFVGQDGQAVKPSVNQPVHFTAQGTIDKVTGQFIDGGLTWSPDQTVSGVTAPFVKGQHVVSIDRDAVDGSQTAVKDVTLSHTDDSYTVKVTYAPNGKIVPVDPNGNPIPKAPTPQYPTDPENPAGVTPNEPVPDVPDYTPSVPTVTPQDPGKDTPVVYTPKTPTPVKQGSVKVVFQDDTTGQLIPDVGYNSGEEDNGTKVTYTTAADLKKLADEGYVYVSTDGTIPATIDGDVTVTVHVKHGVQPITPETPTTDVPKNTPKEAQPDQLTKTVTETVTYVNADGTAFTGTIPANAKQTVTFTGTAYVDKVTGELVNAKQVDGTWVIDKDNTAAPAIAWTPETGSFTAVESPAETGYHADKTSVAAVNNLTPTSEDIQVTVTYTKDATTTPTPTPTEKGSVKVVYHDDTTNTDLTGYGKDSGTVAAGTPFTYDPTTDENTLKNHGYEIVTQNPVIPTEVGNTPQIVTIHVKHGSQPISPKTPGIPGTPINPQDPKGPKYPDGTDAKSLQSDVTRTIQFVDENGKQVADSVEGTAHFTASGVLDKVTGEWITPLTWTGEQTINGIDVPAVAGYHVVKIDRDANGLTKVKDVTVAHGDASYVVTVTYAKDATTPTPTPTPTPEDQVVKGTQTVHYVDQDGNELKPTATTGSVTFTKSGKTGQWDKDSYTYGKVAVPVIPGYVATVTTVDGATVTPEDPNQVITITYTKVGKIIPVDPGGNPIPGVPTPKYPNDPNDPTKVTPNEKVPEIPGWTPKTPTVTPGNPTTDTPVTYVPDKPKPSENPDTPTPNPTPDTPTPTPTPDTPTPDTPTPDTPTPTPTPVTPTPEAPATPATPKPQTPATPAPNQPATPVSPREVTPAPVAKPAAKKLPQTGNAQEGRLATLGLAALSLVGLSAGFLTDKRRKH